MWINICFTSLAGLIHGNNDSHKQTTKRGKKMEKESKHTLYSAGYHISEQSEPQGLERSNPLCGDTALHKINWRATTPSCSQLVSLSHPHSSKALKLWAWGAARASQLPQTRGTAGRDLHHWGGGRRKLHLSSLNLASSKEVPWAM